MEEVSTGALVPSVKPVMTPSTSVAPTEATGSADEETAEEVGVSNMDKDSLCPICMQIIKDAFLTACGHSFCYMCIITHLQNKSDCPCCGVYLTNNQLFPNRLLDKVAIEENFCSANIKNRISCGTISSFIRTDVLMKLIFPLRIESPWEGHYGCEVSVKELDTLLSVLTEKKRKMEQDEAERNMKILMEFLNSLKMQKVDELNETQNDLQYVKEDINVVERHRIELYRARDRYSVKLRMHVDDPMATKPRTSLVGKSSSGLVSSSWKIQGGMASGNLQNKQLDGRANCLLPACSPCADQGFRMYHGLNHILACSVQDIDPHISGWAIQIKDEKLLVRHRIFLDKFGQNTCCPDACIVLPAKATAVVNKPHKQDERNTNVIHREGYSAGLADFQSVLTTFSQYSFICTFLFIWNSRLKVIAELRHGDLFHSANIVSSIEFDCDDELFATAGVSRRIKVFDFSSVVNERAEVHCPVVEMSTRSKLSCLSWNKCTKNHIASSDYEGIVTVWDVNTRQVIRII
ncbi:E3 ubiquitin-protein ligase COP1 [Vitis vinifera]|uniref:E3 ubiquitin-protein ligase COP1 n=1 Tax=Vitis vinifera TaxID=29760 RepID=A0A438CJ80_VITVI|nr:E3 ubiquitin-protein ligase COP1 [Vitis vinifera]